MKDDSDMVDLLYEVKKILSDTEGASMDLSSPDIQKKLIALYEKRNDGLTRSLVVSILRHIGVDIKEYIDFKH